MKKIDKLMQLESALLQADKNCLSLMRERDEARAHVLELLEVIAKMTKLLPDA